MLYIRVQDALCMFALGCKSIWLLLLGQTHISRSRQRQQLLGIC